MRLWICLLADGRHQALVRRNMAWRIASSLGACKRSIFREKERKFYDANRRSSQCGQYEQAGHCQYDEDGEDQRDGFVSRFELVLSLWQPQLHDPRYQMMYAFVSPCRTDFSEILITPREYKTHLSDSRLRKSSGENLYRLSDRS